MELVDKEEAGDKVVHLQRKFYRWSKGGDQDFERLYNLTYNPNFLSHAWYQLKNNSGSKTPGTDGVTLKTVEERVGVDKWLTGIQQSLRDRTFKLDLIRRHYIPKPGKTTMRPLGIPTLEDRLVQMVLKLILEPIFEADFKGCSLGFRPSRGPLHAISQIRTYMNPQNKYNWVIEADIRDCFGNIDHTGLLQRLRTKVKDNRVLSLIRSFLKAGVLDDGKVTFPVSGSPQGGIISPLLANIYLDQLDEFYDTKYHKVSTYHRAKNVRMGVPVLRLVRYADDMVILVKGDISMAERSMEEFREIIEISLKMEFAENKTGIHSLEEGFNFLGYSFRRGKSLRTGKTSTILLPSKESVIKFTRKVKEMTSASTEFMEPDDLIYKLNTIIRGWGQYFRFGWVSRLFAKLDFYLDMRVGWWLKGKYRPHPKRGRKRHGPSLGSWKWVFARFYKPGVTGYRHWNGGKYSLNELRKVCYPIKLNFSTERITTPYNEELSQTKLSSFSTDLKRVMAMESSVQRQRIW